MQLLYGKPPVTSTKQLEQKRVGDVVKLIKTDADLKRATLKIRKSSSDERKQLKKLLLPYVLPFNYTTLTRKASNFKSANMMFFEADHVDDLGRVISELKQDPTVYLLYKSVSGDGFKMLIKLDEDITEEYYLRVYNVLRLSYNQTYEMYLDPSSKDLARVQFLAHDPKVHYNKDATAVDAGLIIQRLQVYDDIPIDRSKRENDLAYNDKDIRKAITYIREHGYLDMADEQLWWELSMSIASLGEAGREYFLMLSQDNPQYPEDTLERLNKKYDHFLKAFGVYHDESRILNMNAFFNKIQKVFGLKAPRGDTTKRKSVELIIADKFAKKYKNQLLYDHSKAGKARTYGWYIWDGHVFKLSQKGEISDYYLALIKEEKMKALEAAKKAAEDGEDIGMDQIESDDKPLGLAQIARAESRRFRDLTLTWAGEREGLGVLPDDLDKDVELFNTLNGVINLRSGELLDPSPDFRMTKISNVTYQKNAKCPNWEDFVLKIAYNNQAVANYIQEAVGYSLTGYTSEQCLFFLYGIGANGKSTFLEGIKLILGEYQANANYETFTSLNRDGSSHSEDVVRLRSARLVVSSEITASRPLNESVIKQITAGDTITARDLHSSSIEFKPTFKLWIAGNHKPKIQNFDRGIRRRIFIIPFEYIFNEREIRPQHEVLEEFRQERSGILNWALEGAQRWFKHKGLKVPDIVADTTKEYFLESNLIEQFIAEKCITGEVAQGGVFEEAKSLHHAYNAFADSLNEDRLGRNQFYRRLEELGFRRGQSSQQQLIFRGIKLKEQQDVGDGTMPSTQPSATVKTLP